MSALMLLLALGCRNQEPEPTTPTTTTPTTPTTAPTGDTGTGPTTPTTTGPTGDTGGGILSDPLSMPLEPTVTLDAFPSAENCVACHPSHVEEWSTSMHAYAMVDPVFQALVEVRQVDREGTEDKFCVSCHSAIGVRSGEVQPGFAFDALPAKVQEGITCTSCHAIDAVERVNNAGHVLATDGVMRGPLADPEVSGFHASTYSPLFDDQAGTLCGSCHDVIETNGLNLERPYEEYVESPLYEEGGRCQDCHMPEVVEPAAVGGPDRDRSSHRFVGVDVPLLEGWLDTEQEAVVRQNVHELLEGAAHIELVTPDEVLAGEQLDLVVSVHNNIDAHNFPTGSTFIRQTWLEVIATDATGKVLYATGDLDANGDLRNYFSELDPYGDDDLVVFSSQLVGADGRPQIFTWRAAEHWVASIPPLLDRTITLFVPTGEAVQGPVTIDARLRFRSHAPYLLRELGLDTLVDRVEIIDVDTTRVVVPLATPAPADTGLTTP